MFVLATDDLRIVSFVRFSIIGFNVFKDLSIPQFNISNHLEAETKKKHKSLTFEGNHKYAEW